MHATPTHPSRGVLIGPVAVDVGASEDEGRRSAVMAQARGWQPVLPEGAAFTGFTAALIHGLWLPRLPVEMPAMVALARRQYETTPVRDGLLVIRHPVAPAAVDVDGIPVVTVPEVLVCCCRYLGLLDAVVLIDSALHQGLVTIEELEQIQRRKRRGVVRFREALELVDGRSESPWESMLRLLHVVCGVQVTPQVEIRDELGRFIARVDLMVDATCQIQEYDGGQHREVAVHLDDLARERRLADVGLQRRGWVARDLLSRPEAVLAPIGAALGRRISARPWRDLLAGSLYRGRGRAEFARKLALESPTWPTGAPSPS